MPEHRRGQEIQTEDDSGLRRLNFLAPHCFVQNVSFENVEFFLAVQEDILSNFFIGKN